MTLTHPATSPVAYANDEYPQGSPPRIIAAFPNTCRLSPSIGFTVRLDKCGVCSPNAMAVAEVVAALRIPHCVNGLDVAGTLVGSEELVTRVRRLFASSSSI